MKDRYGREIEYVRISVTDRCNLSCFYCTKVRKFDFLPHSEILRYEEILEILEVLAKLGIKKVRITGGEPLVRKGIGEFLKKIKGIEGIERLTLTTNGVLVKDFIENFKRAKVDAVNVSLDSVREENYKNIVGKNVLKRVLEGIEALKDAGISTKINTVYTTHNIGELSELVGFALSLNVPIRFIELMPFDENWREHYIPEEVLLHGLSKLGELVPLDHKLGDGPARYFLLKTGKGDVRVGLISALSHNFCHECNRIRITADGNLVPCMASPLKINLREILRSESQDRLERLKDVLEKAIYNKPKRHSMDKDAPPNSMRKLGG